MKIKNLGLAKYIKNFILTFNFENFMIIICKFCLFFLNLKLFKIIEKELAILKHAVQRVHLLMRKIIKDCLLIDIVAYFLLHFYNLVHLFHVNYKYLRVLFLRTSISFFKVIIGCFFLRYCYFYYFIIFLFGIV
jgi:hypothetical protein